ncbi:MAG: hypothetical protein HZA02_08565 [Nitrospinae bacterium]|nr:hypothetical protein [Nitrospinota bacterium]
MIALAREPSPSFVNALSEHPEKGTIDFAKALDQHRRYAAALRRAGVAVEYLAPAEPFPDAVFVEDAAIVLPREAWICSMREPTRGGETGSVMEALRKYRPVEVLAPPAYIDGGDVLNVEGTLYVGISRRTNREAAEILSRRASCPTVPVAVRAGLHLKTSATYLGKNVLVVDPAKVETAPFENLRRVEVEKDESANCLAVGNTVLMSASSPRLAKRARDLGFAVVELDIGEFEKADGGVTCLSLLIQE